MTARMSVGLRARAWLAPLLLLACAVVSGCVATGPAGEARTPKNIIILYGDGAAATQWEFGRYTSRVLRNKSFAITDVIFKEGNVGLLTVHSADSFVTDSAAAATALSTGHKTNNGMAGVTPDGKAVKTVMEAAKASGKRIGLITTAAVHDASPTAFAVHAKSRRDGESIIDQYLALEPDVLMGGGRDFFLPKGKGGGKRTDGRDMLAAFAAKGYQVVQDPAALRTATGPRLLALFSDQDLALEIDRDPKEEPSTAEMTAAAIRILSANSQNGFVLFVENENIDSAGHRNDAAALVQALWAIDDAAQVALDFRRRAPGDTLVLVTGDHETGGLSVTYAQKDLSSLSSANRLYPVDSHLQMVSRIRISLAKAVELIGRKPTAEALDKVVAENFPGFRLDDDLRTAFLKGQPLERNAASYLPQPTLARMISRQTGIYWGTTGHTTEPVVVGAVGPGAPLFRGYMENTDFAKILHKLIEGR
ncbi:MAG TPA: alkaline phosphatase [Burkholderiales bacterium]|nr:alkaline phosphatase [Burkholderiales bacterium]